MLQEKHPECTNFFFFPVEERRERAAHIIQLISYVDREIAGDNRDSLCHAE